MVTSQTRMVLLGRCSSSDCPAKPAQAMRCSDCACLKFHRRHACTARASIFFRRGCPPPPRRATDSRESRLLFGLLPPSARGGNGRQALGCCLGGTVFAQCGGIPWVLEEAKKSSGEFEWSWLFLGTEARAASGVLT